MKAKTIIKGALILGLLGLIFVLCSGFVNGFNFNKVSYEEKSYNVNLNRSFDINTSSVKLESHEGEDIKILYNEDKKYDIKDNNNVISIKEETNKKKWYEYIFHFGTKDTFDVVIYLPNTVYENIKINSDVANIELENIDCYNLDININVGNVNLNENTIAIANMYIDCGSIELDNSHIDTVLGRINVGSFDLNDSILSNMDYEIKTGSANLVVDGIKNEYNLSLDSNVGSGSQKTTGSTEKYINIDVECGSINIDFI